MTELETGVLPGPETNTGDIPEKETKTKKPRGVAAVNVRLAQLEEPLAEKLVEYIGVPMAVVSPLAAGVIDHRADKTAKALIALAKSSPRFRKALETFVTGSNVADLGFTVVAVLMAIRIDKQNLTPDEMGMAAMYLQIDDVWRVVYGDSQEANGNGNMTIARPQGIGADL